jgi:hypothetical protein
VLPADGSGNLLSVHLDRSFRTDRFQQTLGGSFGFFDESKTLPWTGGALNSSIRPTVYGYHVSQYLISDLPWRITNTFRFSLGAAHYDFAAPSNTSNLPSVFSPGTPFLLNQKLILNLTKPNGAPVFTSASSGDPDWVRLLKGFNLGLFGQTEQITGPIGEVHVAGFSPIGVDVFHYPQERAHKTVQLGDTATRTLGAHTITAGFELWDVRLNSTMDQNSRAQVDFYGERSGGIPVAANPSLASTPLLSSTDMVAAGYPGALYQTLSANPQPNLKLHRKQIDFFLQDVWRVSQTLNLSTGIRLELNRVPESDDPRFRQEFSEADFRKQLDRSHSNCVDSPNQDYCDSLIASLTRAFPASFDDIFSRHPLGKDLRVGFAWDPRRGNTVLRGGVGRYTGQFPEILLSEARSALPQYLPLNMADPPPSGFYLSNIAHPGECIYLNTTNKYNCSTNLLHNTLSQLDPGTDLPFFFARDINRLAVLSPVQPAADLRNPYSLQYGVTLDQALWKDTMLSMAYVGTMGRHLLGVSTQSQTPNQPIFVPPAFQSIEPLGGTGFPNFLPTDSATNGFNLKPGPLPLISRTLYASGGNSAYNSLQVEFHGRLVRQRLGQVQFGTAFTYAHAIDNASDFFPVAGEPGSPQDSFQSSERASSAYDARARFAGNFVWTVPYPMGIGDSTRMASRLFQNWRLAGVVVAQTGQPFTVNTSVDVNQDGSLTDRLDQTTVNGQAALIASQSRDRRASFTLSPIVAPETLLSGREMAVGAAGGCFNSTTNRNVCDGSVGRNTFRATGMFTVDLALMRDVRLGKDHAHALHLRAECYNALNRAQFGIPVRILEAPGFGSAVSTIAPNRTIQFGAKLSF